MQSPNTVNMHACPVDVGGIPAKWEWGRARKHTEQTPPRTRHARVRSNICRDVDVMRTALACRTACRGTVKVNHKPRALETEPQLQLQQHVSPKTHSWFDITIVCRVNGVEQDKHCIIHLMRCQQAQSKRKSKKLSKNAQSKYVLPSYTSTNSQIKTCRLRDSQKPIPKT